MSRLPSRLAFKRSGSSLFSCLSRSHLRVGHRFGESGRTLPTRLSRLLFRSDEVHLRRKAELDYVDYRNANGVHRKEPPSEGTWSNGVDEASFGELEEDMNNLDSAKTQNGVWQKLSGIRSLSAYLTDREEFGKRGEGLFVLTVAAAALVFFPPFVVRGVINAAGYMAAAYGIVSAVCGLIAIGSSFSPLPVPRANAQFVDRGIFRFVRHPFYAGLLLVAVGVSIVTGNEFRLLMTAVLYWIFEQTIEGEERDLEHVYPEYAIYKTKVAKLIPFVF